MYAKLFRYLYNSLGTKTYPYVVENPVDGVDIFPVPQTMTEYEYTAQGLVSRSITGIALEGVDGSPYFGTTDKIEYNYGYSTTSAIFGAPISTDTYGYSTGTLHFKLRLLKQLELVERTITLLKKEDTEFRHRDQLRILHLT